MRKTVELRLPPLGEGVEEARLLEWLVQPDQSVSPGQVVAVVETDKSEVEIEAEVAGVLQDLLALPGQVVPAGATLATLEVFTGPRAETGDGAAPAPPPAPPRQTSSAEPPSPAVRRLLARLRLDDFDREDLVGTDSMKEEE